MAIALLFGLFALLLAIGVPVAYALAAAGMPLTSLPPGHYGLAPGHSARTQPQFMQVTVARG